MKNQSNSNREKQEAFQKSWAQIVAKAWSDPTFKEQLIKNPTAVLKEYQIELPQGMQCKIVENNDKILYLTLPQKPERILSETQLKEVAAGTSSGWSTGSIC